MDPITAVRTDALPAIATVFVPGAVAAAPFAYGILMRHREAAEFLMNSELSSTLAIVVICVARGELVESLGSYVEFYVLDRFHANRERMLQDWNCYLTVTWKPEPVGQHYLRRVLVGFKFELNLFVALLIFAAGVVWLRLGLAEISTGQFWKVLALAGFAAAYFLFASKDTSLLLADIRSSLVAASKTDRSRFE